MAEKAEKGIRKRRRKASLGEWSEAKKWKQSGRKYVTKTGFCTSAQGTNKRKKGGLTVLEGQFRL